MEALLNLLNNSKFLAGVAILMSNIGGRYLNLDLTKKEEKFLQQPLIRRLLIFFVAFIATRDIIISLILTGVFILLVSGLFNDNSDLCIIKKHNQKTKLVTKDDVIKAKKIIKKYERQKNLKNNLK